MKTGRVFWGVLLLVIGGLFLLNNLGWYYPDWSGIWKLWPVVLILWGISALVPNQKVKWIFSAFMAILLGMILFWIFSFGWIDTDGMFVRGDAKTQYMNKAYSPDIRRAVLEVGTGATRIEINGTTEDLVEVEARSQFGEYDFKTSQTEDVANVDLSFQTDGVHWRPGSGRRNFAKIKLHPEVMWDLVMRIGAAKAELNLSEFKTERIRIEAGAASIRLRLGAHSPETSVDLQTGVASVIIEVPTDVGCRVEVDAPLSKKSFQGLRKVRDGFYESDNYQIAQKKINIEFDAGVSKLVVKRY